MCNNKFYKFLMLTILLGQFGCNNNPVEEPDFDKTNAFVFVRKQVEFGPRVPNSEAHRNCKNWLVSEFKNHGAQTIEQDFTDTAFDGTILNGTNIIASHNPSAKHRIILAAHWDSRPFSDQESDTVLSKKAVDGADDGASGVGVLLEISRLIQASPLSKLGIDIILFDCEDYGTNGGAIETWCLGSQHWSKNLHREGYKADYGVLLDMVGAKDPYFSQEYYSKQLAPKVVDKVWKLAKEMGFEKNFVDAAGEPIIDDHIFVNQNARIPMINIINRPIGSKTGFVHHWHTQKDNMNAIDPNSLEMVGRVLTRLIYLENADKI
ncbi:MAG: M28 family peptidase [Saprospiraceae bacterium]|nr:M28 family peptidase [Saprospiraceae bacterium]